MFASTKNGHCHILAEVVYQRLWQPSSTSNTEATTLPTPTTTATPAGSRALLLGQTLRNFQQQQRRAVATCNVGYPSNSSNISSNNSSLSDRDTVNITITIFNRTPPAKRPVFPGHTHTTLLKHIILSSISPLRGITTKRAKRPVTALCHPPPEI